MELPLPLDVARSSGNWAFRSQDFFIAGKTLLHEQLRSLEVVRTSERQVIDGQLAEHFAKANMSSSIVFLLAFSTELLVKAVLVKTDASKWIPNDGATQFTHDIFALVTDEIGIQLTDEETTILKRISDYVTWGKYPERRNPNTVNEDLQDLFDYHPYVNWSLEDYFTTIVSIRTKLQEAYDNLH